MKTTTAMIWRALVSTAAATLALASWSGEALADVDDYRLERVETLTEQGGRVAWSPDGQWIAFDRREADGLFDVHLIRVDGSEQRCLTCDHPDLPAFNKGQPEWHPGGRYLLIEVEKQEHAGAHAGSEPGMGIYNDLWVLDLEQGTDRHPAYQLTDVRDALPRGEPDGGVLHSAFNHDGSKLLWTDMEDYSIALIVGNWQLAMADFVAEPLPHLENTVFHNPGPDKNWYEAHGWGPRGSGWIYFSCIPFAGGAIWNADICAMRLDQPDQVRQLTFSSGKNGEPGMYDEHAKMSPREDAFVWASDAVVDRNRMELFMANLDGSGARRITYFNEPDHDHSTGFQTQTWDSSWNPSPAEGYQQLAVIVCRTDVSPYQSSIKILTFEVGEDVAPGGDAYALALRGCNSFELSSAVPVLAWLVLAGLLLRRRS